VATIYKRRRPYPIPEGAEPITYRGKPYVKWTDPETAQTERAPLNAKGNRIIRENPFYTIEYFDHEGNRQRVVTRYADKAAAEQHAQKLERDAEDRRRGMIDPALERFAAQRLRPISQHIQDFRAMLEAKDNSADYIKETVQRVQAVVRGCKATHLPQLTASAVYQAIKDIRDRGRSLETCNSYIRSIKGFARWLYVDRRTPEDALLSIEQYNAATDPRHTRRELTPEEVAYLLPVAEGYTAPCHNLPGPDRAMVYRLVLGTGFRAKELRSLTPASFDLDSDPPTVTVQAACSKRRRLDVQPIRQDLAAMLRTWLADRPAGVRMFGTLPGHTARMLRADLKVARAAWINDAKGNPEEQARRKRSDFLKYRDAAGRVTDFHATRHTYISGIVAGGASVKTAQELARHSTPNLTIGRYSHTRLHDLTGALDSLPDLQPRSDRKESEEKNLRATGTEGTPETIANPNGGLCGAHQGAQYGGKSWRETAKIDRSGGNASTGDNEPQTISFSAKTQEKQGKTKRRARDSNPQPHKGAPHFECGC
jgi:integrase